MSGKNTMSLWEAINAWEGSTPGRQAHEAGNMVEQAAMRWAWDRFRWMPLDKRLTRARDLVPEMVLTAKPRVAETEATP